MPAYRDRSRLIFRCGLSGRLSVEMRLISSMDVCRRIDGAWDFATVRCSVRRRSGGFWGSRIFGGFDKEGNKK